MRVAFDDQAGPMPNLAERYAPELLGAAGAFSVATYRHSILPMRVFEAARIAIAAINGCTVCKAFRTGGHSFLLGIGEGEGVRGSRPDEAFYAAVLAGDLDGLDEQERLAAEYARAMSLDPQGLADDETMWSQMKAVFSDEEIVDLTYCCAGWIGFGRATHVLGVDAACALPEPAAAAA
ncbi:carboxymuconolactone decarboxylase family protein [Sphingomonas daechungensis]|uniref:carboxymuconolactone decarboxylase family protein n=1 Tax=Sphingomonas daechungensis TaxID=1176646 RepID=UPI003783D55F